MIFIMAGSYLLAEICAKERGLRKSQWRCLYDVKQLFVCRAPEVWLFDNWADPPSAVSIKKYCEEQGINILNRLRVPQEKKKRGRKRIIPV